MTSISRVDFAKKQDITRVDRITKKILKDMRLGEVIQVFNSPMNIFITIEKMCEIKNYNGRLVVYDLKKFLVTDTVRSQSKHHFNSIYLDDMDSIKKYVSNLQDARLVREITYHKLLIQKNICVGDVVKRNKIGKPHYFIVQKFKETNADRLLVNCLKLDNNNKITKEEVRLEFRNIKRIKSIKVRK